MNISGLQVGSFKLAAPAVISTLWAVNDLSTMLLMERFYQEHLQEGLDIASALSQAQTWLRDVSAEELSKRFANEEEAFFSQTRMQMPIVTASEYFSRFASQIPQYRPFAHPYYWAAFTFSGS
jgi:CHAT domain-containing protein